MELHIKTIDLIKIKEHLLFQHHLFFPLVIQHYIKNTKKIQMAQLIEITQKASTSGLADVQIIYFKFLLYLGPMIRIIFKNNTLGLQPTTLNGEVKANAFHCTLIPKCGKKRRQETDICLFQNLSGLASHCCLVSAFTI